MESEVQQMIQQRQQKIQEIRKTVEVSKVDADRVIADGVQVFTALTRCIEKSQADFNQTVKEKLKSTETQAEDLIKELQQEVEDLANRSSEMKQLSHSEDHLHLQTFSRPGYVGTLRRSLLQLKENLNMEMKKLHEAEVKRVQLYEADVDPNATHPCLILSDGRQVHHGDIRQDLPDHPERFKCVEHGGVWRLTPGVRRYACELTLDPNTAHRHLSLSEDNREVTVVEEEQSYPDHPERFTSRRQVLCREGLTGRCYWEVERKGFVAAIGVTYRGITRRGGGDDICLGYNNQSWSLYCGDGDRYTAWYNNISTSIRLPPTSVSTRVGVYVDWYSGTLSFYRVSPHGGGSSDTLTHIHTFQTTFTEDLFPGFGLGDDSSVSLCQL